MCPEIGSRGTAKARKTCWAGQFMTMLDGIAGSANGSGGVGLQQFVQRWGWTGSARGWGLDIQESLLPFPVISLRGAWDDLLRKPWNCVAANPRSAEEHVKFATYHNWFALPLPVQVGLADEPADGTLFPRHPANLPRYIQSSKGIPFEHIKNLMRFRLGSLILTVETCRMMVQS